MNNNKSSKRIIITALYLAVIIALTIFMNIYVTAHAEKDNSARMKALAGERSVIITDYTDSAEFALSSYSMAKEIRELIADPSNPEKIASAQKYTDEFSRTVNGIEGIYISQWDTGVLAHTNTQYIGMTTRTGEALKQLRQAVTDSGNDVYNAGIIISPSSGKQILSMYKAICDDSGNPLGIAGLGVYMESIENKFQSLKLNTENSVFSMINVSDDKYILCSDNEKTGTQTDNSRISELCGKLRNSDKKDSFFEYEENGKVSLYAYISDYDWLMVIDSPKGEVYRNSRIINLYMILFSILVIVWTVIFNFMLIRQEKTEQKLENSRRKQETIKSSLHNVAFHDILTDVNNRIKFIDDFGKDESGRYKIENCPERPYFFVMFSIKDFSSINMEYGQDAGDEVLVTTADILKNYFNADDIYRTGSDEFVVAVQCPAENTDGFIKKIRIVSSELKNDRKIRNNIIRVDYMVSAIKKSSSITPAVLIVLKDIIKKNTTMYVDMDK